LEGGHLSWKSWMPTTIKPVFEAGSNEGWTGMPIYKKSDFNKHMPDWTKAYSNANKQLLGLAEALNDATGGTRYEKGLVDLNPAAIEYLLNAYLGGYFSMSDKVIKTAETVAGKREFDTRSIPLLNRVLRQGDERTEYRAVNNEFYRIKEEAADTKRVYNAYRKDTDRGVFDYADKIDFLENSPRFGRMQIYEEYSREINAIAGAIKQANELGDELYAKEMEKDLMEMKRDLVNDVNDYMKEMRQEERAARP
ncbi:MAG: hypothetical protein LUC18_01070, partial [Porphyromonadaceae bacterium]|nr:hypothetical protein [Porphyromonadaceae bacterium]